MMRAGGAGRGRTLVAAALLAPLVLAGSAWVGAGADGAEPVSSTVPATTAPAATTVPSPPPTEPPPTTVPITAALPATTLPATTVPASTAAPTPPPSNPPREAAVVIDPLDLSISPEVQARAVGDVAEFFISVYNQGDVILTDIEVEATIGATPVPDCSRTAGHAEPIPDLAPDHDSTYVCTVPVTEGFTLSVEGSAVEDDGVPAFAEGAAVPVTASASADVALAALTIEKGPDPALVDVEGVVEFEITLTNTGDVRIFDVVIVDPLVPDCVPLDSGAFAVEPDEVLMWTCADVDVESPYTNEISAEGEFVIEPGEGSDVIGVVSDSDTAEVTFDDPPPEPSISVTKSPDVQDIAFGGTATFDITVTNDGDVALSDVFVEDPLSVDCERTPTDDPDLEELLPDESVSWSCTADGVTEDFTNEVLARAGDITDTDTADVEVGPAAVERLSVTKSPDLQSVDFRGDATFEITVTNDGDVALTDVTLTDALTPACDRDSGDLPGLASLAVGAFVTYECTAEDLTEDFVNEIVASAGEATDADTAAVVVGPEPVPGVRITKTALDPQVLPGQDADFEITVENTGAMGLTSITVDDPLVPACDTTVAPLAIGEDHTFQCTAVAGTDFTADFTNVAEVEALGVDCELCPVSDSDTAAVDMLRGRLSIVKRALNSVITVGEDAEFEVVVTNTGEITLEVVVTDRVAPGCAGDLGRLPVGARRTLSCRVDAPPVGEVRNVAVATGSRVFTAALDGSVFVQATSNEALVTVVEVGAPPPPPPDPPPPPPPTIIVTSPDGVLPPVDPPLDPVDPIEDPSPTTDAAPTTTVAPADTSDDSIEAPPVTLLTGSILTLEGTAPPDCDLRLLFNGEDGGPVATDADGGYTLDVPTAGLPTGPHEAELACADGRPVWKGSLQVVRTVETRSPGQPLLIFVLLLVVLAVMALLGGRPPVEQGGPTTAEASA